MAGNSHDGPPNRLAQEKSPYLLQHARNPVNWYPWGEEAFEHAKEMNRPVFLSVGYSTCHWCHVMERESFVNQETAKLMNENFINIKVDREERPDVDRLYMNFVTSTQGHGGWPMSVFLTPNGEPLSGGTYYPPEDKWGTPGFKRVLTTISDQWKNHNNDVRLRGQKISSALRDGMKPKPGQAPPPKEMRQKTYNHFVENFDNKYAGFGNSTKFPNPVDLDFLMSYYKQNCSQSSGHSALEMLDKTLTAIDNGGIHDHLGKGFHRYSVDRKWRIPHYEKMLYDQGQLLSIYSNFYKKTSKFGQVVEDIVEYVKKDLTHKLGGFFSAEDAESYPTFEAKVKGEGSFYVWTYDDLKKALSPEQFEAFSSYYGVEKNGNAPPGSDPHNELTGQNTFYVGKKSIEAIASDMKISEDDVWKLINGAKQTLLPIRDKRPRPGLDSKIITAWNGLMISGLTAAYGAFPDKKEYLQMAQNAVKFLKDHLVDKEGRLLRTAYSDDDGEKVIQIPKPILAFADDYSFLIQALIDLYEVDLDVSHLQWAKELQTEMDELFFDNDSKAGYFNARQDPTVFARLQEDQDGAEPCANSIAASNLLRLSDIFGNQDYKEKSQAIFNGHASALDRYPFALPKMVLAASRAETSAMQIVVVSPKKDDPNALEMLRAINSRYIPAKNVIYLSADSKEHEYLLSSNPQLRDQLEAGKESAAVYICQNFTCSLPIRDLNELEKRITAAPKN